MNLYSAKFINHQITICCRHHHVDSMYHRVISEPTAGQYEMKRQEQYPTSCLRVVAATPGQSWMDRQKGGRIMGRVVSSEISCGIFPEISGKITVLFRNNSAKNFREVCGRKFHETLMQLQHSNVLIAFMHWWLLTKFTCLLTLCTLSRQTHLAVAGKQTSSVNDVIHYECTIDKTLHVRKISGFFMEKFRKVSDILFFRKTYNPNYGCAVSKKWLRLGFRFGFAKNCSFRFGFGFTRLTVVSVFGSVFWTVCCLMCMTLEMMYFRAELAQLIVSQNDSELEVQRYGMTKNTLTVDPIMLQD